MTTTTACRGGRTTGALWAGRSRPCRRSRRNRNETRDTMIGHTTDRGINRFENPTTGAGARSVDPIRPTGHTSRDIEAEVLVRLARKGYDWTGTLRGRRGGLGRPPSLAQHALPYRM